MTHVEITRALFLSIIDIEEHFKFVEHGDGYRKTHYNADGVNILEVENYVSGVRQFYVQDINA